MFYVGLDIHSKRISVCVLRRRCDRVTRDIDRAWGAEHD